MSQSRDCGTEQSARVIVTDGPTPGRAFDIELPSNHVRVRLRSRDGSTLEDPKASLAVLKGSSHAAHYVAAGTASLDTFVFDAVPNDRPLLLCGEATGHERTCVKVPPLAEQHDKTVELTLDNNTLRGLIIAAIPLEGGTVFWSDEAGRVTEQVPVASDGSFTYRQEHDANAIVSVVSANLPLRVSRQGAAVERLTITVPTSPQRTFRVAVADPERFTRARVALHVGRCYVPANVLAHHQLLRGQDVRLDDNGSVALVQILESEPITVTLGPAISQERLLGEAADIVSDSAIGATLPRKILGGSSLVRFP